MATFPRKTPQITSEGLFVLRPPFADLIKANTVYTVEAIRSFQELTLLNIDIFGNYYNPMGLSETDYADDASADVFIITLTSKVAFSNTGDSAQSVIYVPDSYILQFPDGDNVNYYNYVLSIEMGPLPEWWDGTQLVNDLRDNVKAKTGLELDEPTLPEVFVFRNSYPVAYSSTDSAIMEQARQAAITDTEPTSVKMRNLQASYDLLLAKYQALEAYILNTAAYDVEGMPMEPPEFLEIDYI